MLTYEVDTTKPSLQKALRIPQICVGKATILAIADGACNCALNLGYIEWGGKGFIQPKCDTKNIIDADGIYWNGIGNSTISAGEISTVGANADGIWASMEFGGTTNLSVVNDHTISATGVNAMGIKTDSYPASGNHASIINTGTISSAQSYGIYTTGTGSDTIITNSGMISGTLGAVKFAGTGNTLSLLAGSKIVGLLDIAGTGGNTLSIGKRLNTALTYTYMPSVTITTNGMPYAFANVNSNRVVFVVDPTLFAAEDDMVADLSRSVGNAIDARLGSAIGQSANTIMASTVRHQRPWNSFA